MHRLNTQVFVLHVTDNVADRDCSRIELPCLSIIDRDQFGGDEIRSILHTHSCNHSVITTLFQTYLLTLSQINSKNYLFHTFVCSQTNKVESV